jgi:aminoglycoside 3-N-acetyltransferase I
MNIQIKKLTTEDVGKFQKLLQVFEDVFEMTNFAIPEEKYLTRLLAKEDFFVFVALSNDRVIGGLTAYTLQQYYTASPLAFIYDIGIEREAQRKGAGQLLITNMRNYCKDKGFEEMFVLADEVDKHALEFYRSTGAEETKVLNFNYVLNTK